jgi:TatD DNase family protein
MSIPGPVTFPANRALRAAVATAPLERLCTETDCPYLAPQPVRGKRNEPANTAWVIETMAAARSMPVQDLWTVCGDNARRFFAIESKAASGADPIEEKT